MKSKSFLYIALATDVLIAITKFLVGGLTRSSAMISEGVHSVIDAISQVLLLWGVVTSKRQPDDERPFGYGRELYFWSFIVSLIIFMMGGCISLYEGILRFKKPATGENETWNYIVLGISFIVTAVSGYASFKVFNRQRGDTGFWKAVTNSKDPSVFIVVLGDAGDLVCLIIAFAGVYLGHITGNSYYDAFASVLIGIILILISMLLVRESRSLLMGETLKKATLKQIVAITEADPSVIKVKQKLSIYLGPEEIVLQMTAVFEKQLTTDQITGSIRSITYSIQEKFPLIKQIFIEPVTG
jgi:cation diffusion facilitator family transporter